MSVVVLDASMAVELLAELPIDRAPTTGPLLHDAWAMRHDVTMSDALYLALARSVGGRVLTVAASCAGPRPS